MSGLNPDKTKDFLLPCGQITQMHNLDLTFVTLFPAFLLQFLSIAGRLGWHEGEILFYSFSRNIGHIKCPTTYIRSHGNRNPANRSTTGHEH